MINIWGDRGTLYDGYMQTHAGDLMDATLHKVYLNTSRIPSTPTKIPEHFSQQAIPPSHPRYPASSLAVEPTSDPPFSASFEAGPFGSPNLQFAPLCVMPFFPCEIRGVKVFPEYLPQVAAEKSLAWIPSSDS